MHKANCLDFALADLRVQLGIEIVPVPRKVKEEIVDNAVEEHAVGFQSPIRPASEASAAT